MSTRVRRPWWLDGGTESCEACTHVYVYEMEFRCVACDGGVCCHCIRVDVATGDVLCPSCEAEAVEG